jgi:hypothetical protein
MKGFQFVYLSRPGDKEMFQEFRKTLSEQSDEKIKEELDKLRNEGAKFSAHAYLINLIALHEVAKERKLDSPILISEDGLHLSIQTNEDEL